jgi:hypothetical protein
MTVTFYGLLVDKFPDPRGMAPSCYGVQSNTSERIAAMFTKESI